MVRPADPSNPAARIVELQAVGPEFPLYGSLTLRDGAYSHGQLTDHGALVRPELLAQFGLNAGDGIQIGTQTFEIRGVITAEPGRRLGAFTLGPRVIIDRADLECDRSARRLGAACRTSSCCACPRGSLRRWRSICDEAFADEFVNVRWYRRTEDQMGENLTRAENYLSLVGLVVLILGGIGVSSVTRVFVQQKVRSIAILKCVGSSSTQMLAIYMAQMLLLGLAGSTLGVALAAAVLAAVPAFVGDLVDADESRFRADDVRRPSGRRDWAARVGPVLAGAVARGAARQAVAAVAAGHPAAVAVRLAEMERHCGRGNRAGRGGLVAGRLR